MTTRGLDQTVITGGMEVRMPDSLGRAPGEVSSNVLPRGARLGEFEITGVLGEGGFGIVYLARDTHLDRTVAIKEYMPASIAGRIDGVRVVTKSENHGETFAAGLRSFVNEAKLLAQFDHPALVKVFRFWEAHGTAYMAMPFYPGVTVKRALRDLGKPPDEAWLLDLLLPLLDALELLHGARCYHRDIAPDNILLLPDGRPVLLDFGAARQVIGDMTQALTVILKPGFAPIEQYAEIPGMRQGPWTDLYALAAVAYFAMTGQVPLPSVARMMSDSMPTLKELAGQRYRRGLVQTLDKALRVKPEDRIQTAAAMRKALLDGAPARPAPAAASTPGAAQPPPPATRTPPAGAAPRSVEQSPPADAADETRTFEADDIGVSPSASAAYAEARARAARMPEIRSPEGRVAARSAADTSESGDAGGRARRPERRLKILPVVGITAVIVAVGLAWWTLQPDTAVREKPVSSPAVTPPPPVPAAPPPVASAPAEPRVTIPSPRNAERGPEAAPAAPGEPASSPAPGPARADNGSAEPVPAPAETNPPAAQAKPSAAETPPPVAQAKPSGAETRPPAATTPVPAAEPPKPLTAASVFDVMQSAGDAAWAVTASADLTRVRIGRDKLRFQIASPRSGYVYIFMLGTDRQHVYQLFPNALDRQNQLTGGRAMELPRAGWSVLAGGPAGSDDILVVISASPRAFSALRPGNPFGELDISALKSRYAREGARALVGKARCDAAGAPQCDRFGTTRLRIEEVDGVDSAARPRPG